MNKLNKIRWLGHSGFEIWVGEKTVLIDPFITENPKTPVNLKDINEADLICVTHDHMDHLGDSIEICKKTRATFIGIYELGNYAESRGVEDVIGMNIGATIEVKGIKVSMVQAFHSSQRGSPCGYILDSGEKRIYHAGDTGLFGDMKIIGEYYKPDVACLPIGGYYTMGAEEAVEAVKLIEPEMIIPMHYLTFPVLAKSANEFIKILGDKAPEIKPIVLDIGEEKRV